MYEYKAPLKDFEFTYFDLFDYERHLQTFPMFSGLDRDVVMSVAREFSRFAQNVIAPLNQSGDAEACRFTDGTVTTPSGFKAAYDQYVKGGWPGLAYEEHVGGQGLPESVTFMLNEIAGSANWAWYTYPGLAHGAKNTLLAHGTPWQQDTFLKQLVSGEWTATMCLTETHCGTDLGLLRTRAEPRPDGSYAITGTKIFITGGEHDLAPNIIHIVLARLPDAPPGTKGISLFIVPKVNVDDAGQLATPNAVKCGSIEHKMGIRGSATCVMNFDGATGYLLGEPNKGLNAMFVFMNTARLGTAIQGVAHAEFGLQKSAGYAMDRLQMRAAGGAQNPDGPADPIIVHPDVRRMLLTQKAIAEGGRMLVAYCGRLVDQVEHASNAAAAQSATDLLSFLTPIAKAFLTEHGLEASSLAIQCFGGHGYIKEWGVEQNLRDCRIATLYEGTTGVQALDLLGRKVLATQGKLMAPIVEEMLAFCQQHRGRPMVDVLKRKLSDLERLTGEIATVVRTNPDALGSASVDYLMYAGYVLLSWLWARAAIRADEMIAEGRGDTAFLRAKVHTAEFYFARLLPRTEALALSMRADAQVLMSMDVDGFLAHV
ncbi:acyl-CoA dehydrogenase C-terminal domain-containing protein [Burkholderia sp. D-99]|uniref:acyl-CoA dehydrogenase C-terminal domain-containing protein n=1 Tax=Burkholderia sp. D-99 TaxID=2717316 RepID=UPI001420602F|nr:acyl-CoA dehydrogenase C-terminal domain-containing protein [Burkholderia sp. D-99]NHV25904.1 acyl-CoA dehydrogenase [Burkholderia sp. D-99]